MKASYKQIKKIWAVAKEIGLLEEELRDIVEKHSNQRHISRLSREQARAVIDELERLAGREPNKFYRGERARPGIYYLVSEAQIAMMKALAEKLNKDEDWLLWFIKRRTGKALYYLERREAQKIIEALKAMVKRNGSKRGNSGKVA